MAHLHALYDDSPGLEAAQQLRQDIDTAHSTHTSPSRTPPSQLDGDTTVDHPGRDEPYGQALQRVLTGESIPNHQHHHRSSKRYKVYGTLLGRPRPRRHAKPASPHPQPHAAAAASAANAPRNGAAPRSARQEAERLARIPDSEKAHHPPPSSSSPPSPSSSSNPALLPPPKPAKRHGVKERVLHFTPSWFSVTMGTGVIATLLNLLPWPSIHSGLRYPALVFLFADIVIFILFLSAFVARYIMYPEVLPLTIKHPQKSMFLGTLPMGLIVIISGIAQMGTVEFGLGHGFALAASGLWWLATALSLLTAVGVPFSMMTYQKHQFSGTTAALLLPIVPPITAAATGSVLAEILMERYPAYAMVLVVVSYLVLGIGLPVALLILVLYFQRLLLFNSPPRDVIISVFLPLGPCGQGGEALLHLGQVAQRLLPRISTAPSTGVPQLFDVGSALYGVGLVSALMLFGLGCWWLLLALATIARELARGRLYFNMGWWGLTFPFASLAICCARLAIVLDSLALKCVYTALVLANLALWTTVAIPTLRGAWSGRLFNAPCLADLPLKP